MDVINKAQHYIFLENQYLISNNAGNGVQNRISEAIVDRIRWAIKSKRKFRVFILLPVTPDGNYQTSSTIQLSVFFMEN